MSGMKQRLLEGQHLSLQKQIGLLSEFVHTIEGIPQVLDEIQRVPNAWVGAGIIFQNVWNLIHDFEINTHIKDIDLFYWDENDLSWEAENQHILDMNQALADINIPIDMKNIARIHLWYEARFGIPKAPYGSVQESISTWPVIGACMAMRKSGNDIEFIAPHGFQDMFALQLRPNKILISEDIYHEKAQRWKAQWPLLTMHNW
ncbi:nucleotidyltransferase family protein [Leucothrix sargassi]|nr:nucleotidyltransferase family protein [Leucothrix sargassi]